MITAWTSRPGVDQIENDLTGDDWMAIFQASHRLEESDTRDGQMQISAPLAPRQREPSLRADSSTPPPAANLLA